MNKNESFWVVSTPTKEYPRLNEDIRADVVIIGAGMTGITSAYLLAKDGLKVAVLEADRTVLGTTAHTTAKLTAQHGLIYDQIRRQVGLEKAKQYADANQTAIEFVAKTIVEEQIECNFSRQSAYIYTQVDQYLQKLEDEQTVAAKLGFKAFLDAKIPIPLAIKEALRFDDQAQFHPRKYLAKLAQRVVEMGGSIFEQSRVVDLEGDNPYSVRTLNGNKVTAPIVIMASHYPMNYFPGLFFSRLYEERAYAIMARVREVFPGGMYINAESPTRSLRSVPTEDGEMILFVGEKHKAGHGQDLRLHYDELMAFAQQLYTVEDFPYRWSTQDCTTLDDIPYIGRMTMDKPNLYIATGFRKWGMTHSTVAGLMIRDLIVKKESPWEDVYKPSRISAMSAVNFVVQNADVAVHFVSGKLQSGEEEINLKPGEAVLANVDGQRAGVYMDDQQRFHTMNTTCTHLGCELSWNDAEVSWDCPCHGSRFTIDGQIVEGPALKALEPIQSQQ